MENSIRVILSELENAIDIESGAPRKNVLNAIEKVEEIRNLLREYEGYEHEGDDYKIW